MFAVFYGCRDSGWQEPQGLAAADLHHIHNADILLFANMRRPRDK